MTFDLKRRLGKLELVIRPSRGPTPMQADGAAREFDARMTKLSDVIRAEIGELGAAAVMQRVIRHGSAAEMLVLLGELEIPQAILDEYQVAVTDWADQDLAAWEARVRTLLRELLREDDEGGPSPKANGHATTEGRHDQRP